MMGCVRLFRKILKLKGGVGITQTALPSLGVPPYYLVFSI